MVLTLVGFGLDFQQNLKKKKKNQNQNGRLKKTEFFNYNNSQYFLAKILGIGPWVKVQNPYFVTKSII